MDFFIRVRYITLFVEFLLLIFSFLEGAWSKIFNICLDILLVTSAQDILRMRRSNYASSSLVSLLCSLDKPSVFPGSHSMTSSDWFDGGASQSILVILGHACLACPRLYLALLISTYIVALCRNCFLEDLLGMIKALPEPVRIYFPALKISSNFQTGWVDQRSYLIPILILFDWYLSLVFGIAIKQQRRRDNFLAMKMYHISYLLEFSLLVD